MDRSEHDEALPVREGFVVFRLVSIGLPALKLHELRHTFATLVLESGAFDMFELSRLMGHASVAITDKVYAHLRKKDYATQRARFSAFVTGARSSLVHVAAQLSPALT